MRTPRTRTREPPSCLKPSKMAIHSQPVQVARRLMVSRRSMNDCTRSVMNVLDVKSLP